MKYQNVKQEIKNRQTHSQGIHKQIQAAKGDERAQLWEEKREYGTKTRWVLLSYAFLRGVPYRVVERSCRIQNTWSREWRIHSTLQELGFEVDRNDIAVWLEVPAEGEELEGVA